MPVRFQRTTERGVAKTEKHTSTTEAWLESLAAAERPSQPLILSMPLPAADELQVLTTVAEVRQTVPAHAGLEIVGRQDLDRRAARRGGGRARKHQGYPERQREGKRDEKRTGYSAHDPHNAFIPRLHSL